MILQKYCKSLFHIFSCFCKNVFVTFSTYERCHTNENFYNAMMLIEKALGKKDLSSIHS